MERDIVRIRGGRKEVIRDSITDEFLLTLYLDNKEFVSLSCTPEKLEELSVGFLYSTGLIHSLDDIEHITVNAKDMVSGVILKNKHIRDDMVFKKVYSSGCGQGLLYYPDSDDIPRNTVTGDFRLQAENISELMKSFERKSSAYKKTGGVHCAALSDANHIVAFCEDIGRHNAIDKIIGEALFRNLNMAESVVMTSGRISSDLVFKVLKMGAPIVVSRGAPTSLAIRLAEQGHVTLVGFARGTRMNVYTAPERIV